MKPSSVAFLTMMATLFGASIARISLAEQAWAAGLILCPMIMAARATAAGWLPPELRTPSYEGPGSNAWAEKVSAELIGEEATPAQAAPLNVAAE